MVEEQSTWQEETVELRKKIQTKFEILDRKENESTRIIQRGKDQGNDRKTCYWERNLDRRDSRSERKNARADDWGW